MRGLNDERIPERDLIPRLQVESLENRVAPVYDNLPREVVGNDLTRRLRLQRFLRLSAQVDREFLENLSADDTGPRFPQILYKRFGALVSASEAMVGATAEPLATAPAPETTASAAKVAVPAIAPALPAAPAPSPLLYWIGGMFLAAFAGYLCGGAQFSEPALGAVLAIAIAGVAAFGYACGRGAGPMVLTLDPGIAGLLARQSNARP